MDVVGTSEPRLALWSAECNLSKLMGGAKASLIQVRDRSYSQSPLSSVKC